ncbi:MAG: hypothetical protein JXN60_05605 [Lentisphaerae bacterium]|nr:hypothetical protein [Lentisphaerota bacterium]
MINADVIRASLDDVIPVIVVIAVIIAQLIKAITKRASKMQAPDSATTGDISPNEELQAFLRNLTGIEPTPITPPPPPPVLRPSPPVKPRPAVAKPPQPARRVQSKKRNIQPAPAIQPAVHRQIKQKTASQQAGTRVAIQPITTKRRAINGPDIGKLLRNAQSAKEIIAMREILGPPLAMRSENKSLYAAGQ